MDANKFKFKDNTLKKTIQQQKRNATNERHILLRQQLGMKDTSTELKETELTHHHDNHTDKISVKSPKSGAAIVKKGLPAKKEAKEKILKSQKQPDPKLNKQVESIMNKMKQNKN